MTPSQAEVHNAQVRGRVGNHAGSNAEFVCMLREMSHKSVKSKGVGFHGESVGRIRGAVSKC